MANLRKSNKVPPFIILGVMILVVGFFAMRQDWFMGVQRSLQNKFYDYDSASPEIIVIAIDEKTLEEDNLGSLTSWSRSHYAKAIDILNTHKAAAIGIDITLPDSSPHGTADDQILANTLKQHSNVVLASRYYFEGGERQTEWPNETIQSVNPTLGWINVQLDEDGFVRKVPLFSESEKGTLSAFSVALAKKYLKADPMGAIPAIVQHDPQANITVHSMYINYAAAPNHFRHISMVDLLRGDFVDKRGNLVDFTDKIVIIGPTAVDLQDDYLSPVSEGVRMAGAEVHANSVQTIIEERFLQDQPIWSLWLMLLIITVGNLFLFSFLKVRYAAPLLFAEMVGFVVLGILAYELGFLMNVIYPILISLASFVGSYVLRFLSEQKDRRFIEDAFGHYVNETVVNYIKKHPDTLKLGGDKREITIFFSDIEGFTHLSEGMSPAELVSFLNEYLEGMTEIVLKNEGTLDKYEGDCIMAFWNAPMSQENHALKACIAALENQKKLMELREKWVKEGKPVMNVRIGINTGEAVVGNMGSSNRFDYTAMGDSVNLSSRLESINKQYGTGIIIAEQTYQKVKDTLLCRELDLIRVKGKDQAVRIYELLGKRNEVSPQTLKKTEEFAKALTLYRNREFAKAREIFGKLVVEDVPASVFAKRCVQFTEKPPADDWGGVWTFETK